MRSGPAGRVLGHGLNTYLDGLTERERQDQVRLLTQQDISTVIPDAYGDELPVTVAEYPAIDLGAYADNSVTWSEDNVQALGSEYTSRAWDDNLSPGWGWFVLEATKDVLAAGVF